MKNMKKKSYIESEIEKFLEKCGDKNSIKLKNEARQILYSLYRSKVLTKTVYNNLIKFIRA